MPMGMLVVPRFRTAAAAVAVVAVAAAVHVAAAAALTLQLDPSCSPHCTQAFDAAVDKCRSASGTHTYDDASDVCTIAFASGQYIFGGPVRTTSVATVAGPLTGTPGGITLTGYGAEVVLANMTGAFQFQSLSNVLVEGLSFDMARQPYTLGRATSKTATTVSYAVNASDYPWPGPDGGGPQYSWLYQVQSVLGYDAAHDRVAEHALDLYILTDPAPLTLQRPSAPGGTAMVTLTLPQSAVSATAVGSWYILRHQVYSFQSLEFWNVTGVTVRDVNLYSTPGMGLHAALSSDILLERMRVAKKPGRPMSTTADAVHLQSCSGAVVIRDGLFEGCGDDLLNVHGQFGVIGSIVSPTLVTQMEPNNTMHANLVALGGDTILFRDRDTMRPLGTATLGGIGTNTDNADNAGDAATDVAAPQSTVHFATPIPSAAKVGDLMEDVTRMPSVLSVNNTYRNNRARGQLIKTHDVTVTNCTYDHNTGPAIQVATDGCYWFESGPVTNWTVGPGNTFIGVNYGPAAAGGDVYVTACTPTQPNLSSNQAHFNVSVVGNTFVQDQGEAAVAIWAANGVTIDSNTVTYAATAVPSGPSLVTTGCVGVERAGNQCGVAGSTLKPC